MKEKVANIRRNERVAGGTTTGFPSFARIYISLLGKCLAWSFAQVALLW